MKHAPAIGDYITTGEVAALSTKSDARVAATLLFQAGLAVAAFAVAILWPNPLTILGAIVILGGRIQAFGIITHDCAHGAFFRTPRLMRRPIKVVVPRVLGLQHIIAAGRVIVDRSAQSGRH